MFAVFVVAAIEMPDLWTLEGIEMVVAGVAAAVAVLVAVVVGVEGSGVPWAGLVAAGVAVA